MIRRGLRACTCIFLLLGAALGSADGQVRSMVGEKAADFSLRGVNHSPVRLSDYKGKVILLDFWATWCAPCQTEIPQFIAFQNKFAGQGFQMIGISMDDTVEPVRKFQLRFKMNYPVAMGDTKVASAYGGVLGLPMAFLIGKDGRIVKIYDSAADTKQMESDIRKIVR